MAGTTARAIRNAPANIDVVDAVPVRSRNGLDRFAGLSEDAAGDMHEDVEAVALLFDKPGDGALVGHIKCGDGNRPASFGNGALLQRLEFRQVDVCCQKLRRRRRQKPRRSRVRCHGLRR